MQVQSSGIALQSGSLSLSPTTSVLSSSFLISNRPNLDFSAAQPPGSSRINSTPRAMVCIDRQSSGSLCLTVSAGMAITVEHRVVGNPITLAATTYSSTTVPSATFPASFEARSLPTGNASPSEVTLDPNLAADSGGQMLASPKGAISASVPIAHINATTFVENLTQVLTATIECKNSTVPTPIWTVTNGQHFAEVAAAFPTTSGILSLESTKTAPLPVSTIVNSTGTFIKWSNGQSTYFDISPQQYLFASFVPLILATLFTIPWKIIDNTIKEMEPFYQLSRPGGATAENSICLDYATSTIFTVPIKAISRGHMLVFCSSLISLAVMFLPSLASQAIFVSINGRFDLAWAVFPNLIRIIQALLSLIAILVILMIAYSCKRTYNIYSEPLSIAGLACLLSLSPALETFQRIDIKTKQKELNRLLAGKHFAILELSEMGQSPCPAIVELSAHSPSTITNKSLPQKELRFQSPETPESTLPSDFDRVADEEWLKPEGRLRSVWQKLKTKVHFCLAMLFLCFVFILIAIYYFTFGDSWFERWMDSEAFGVRFAWTAWGTAIKWFLSHLNQDLRRNEPYHRLLLGSARPEDSILVPVYMPPFSTILPSLRRRHFYVSLICFASVFAEFLPIVFGNIPYTIISSSSVYKTCSMIAIALLLFMMTGIAMSILRPRKRVKSMFRKPHTLASICCYVASSPSGDGDATGILDKMRGLSKMATIERNSFVAKSKGLYAMGFLKGGELSIDCDERITTLWSA